MTREWDAEKAGEAAEPSGAAHHNYLGGHSGIPKTPGLVITDKNLEGREAGQGLHQMSDRQKAFVEEETGKPYNESDNPKDFVFK